MADPATYRPRPGEIPTSPGVYRFRDEHGRVIYVGKAKNLRQRLSNYFQDLANLHHRTRTMVTTAASVEWTVVGTEVEALALEYTWIQQYDPRFNVKYRDDKSYPYLAVTLGEEIPRAQVMRGAKRKGTRYFGPYGHAWAIRETLDQVLRVFPIRTCSAGVYRRAARSGRPCLLGYIDKCSAPCVGRISPEDHRELALDFCDFMSGETKRFEKRLTSEMTEAAQAMEYERAARLRDDIEALRRATEKNAVVLGDGTDADVFALAGDELEAAVQVFHVRGGRIRGQRGWVVEKVEDISDAELVEHLLQQVYGAVADLEAEPGADEEPGTARPGDEARLRRRGEGAPSDAVPREVLVPVLPPDPGQVTAWLTGLRGARVDLRVPQRGDKKELAATVRRNAEHSLVLHKTRRAGDLTTRSQALQEIQEALDLDSAPLRIECYDVSHTGGTYQSASMVVFEDGLPRKSEYRTFSVRGPEGDGARDDTAAMHEVITRRFKRYLSDRLKSGDVELASGEVDPEDAARPEDSRRFAYPPSLVVVDGGPPQVAAAARALEELGVTDVALCGLAKRLEEVWIPGDDYPVILRRSSEGLYLLQRVRDEAHRFAIQAHRRRRSKGMVASVLDDVPGLGPARKKALLAHFGSVKKLRAASAEEIATVRGMGAATAAAVVRALAPASGGGEGERASGEAEQR
ncbi:excinuclease ABC subunit UvrC [Myceligenerans pegani]|uniref:UvrABC system protein C n=1 Tax=Myceligenerans pegani TaxID=2776917 RepID=A0ABR9N5I4_9MICO|nr:excinuclease ABC subunit UvrC [Myceligenerans sp. TRM 65318]MBE1878908.1 excinuclease ABC subunit UvrC [Myceligenerans sp. TRM 65318]MBE3021179.1 excinuclease ABC subunit UvrC [Myceligenerans sp. TRM 65318]